MTLSPTVNIEVTQFALDCLEEIETLGVQKGYSAAKSADFVENLLLRSINAISENPYLYNHNPQLLDYGIKMRQRFDETDHWCIYEIKETRILIMLFVHSKQDMISTLYRHQILRN